MLGEDFHCFYECLAKVKQLGYYFFFKRFFRGLHYMPLCILQKSVMAFDNIPTVRRLHRLQAFRYVALQKLLDSLLTLLYMAEYVLLPRLMGPVRIHLYLYLT